MKYNQFNTIEEAVADAENAFYPKNTDTHTAVVIKTRINARKYSVGVQFWTTDEIKAGKRQNADHTTAELIQPVTR